jgi:hypothetical protein
MNKPTQDDVLFEHKRTTVEVLKAAGALAVATPVGQKDPGYKRWDPKSNDATKSEVIFAETLSNSDNIGVHLCGDIVDVDVDTDNPDMIEALDHFLPPTPHVWGRASRLRTHRLYQLNGMEAHFDPSLYGFIGKIQGKPEIATEIRGGEKKSGQYSIMPGSLHPSGEAYLWDNLGAAKTTLAQTSIERIVNGVRFAALCATMKPHWIEGQRNQMCMALSGFMHRASTYAEDGAMGLFFDKEDALSIMRYIAERYDDESDFYMRIKTFEKTWDKAEAGSPVSGASTIKELTGDPDIIGLLYSLLVNTDEMQQLDAVFERFIHYANTTTYFDAKTRGDVWMLDTPSLRAELAGHYLTAANGTKVKLAEVFLESSRKTKVARVGLNPGEGAVYHEHDEEDLIPVLNRWKGWAIPPHPEPVPDSDVEVFRNYVWEVICSEDEKVYEWVMAWLADIFADPTNKPGTALVLVGEPGAGKSILFEMFLNPIIGRRHSLGVSGTQELATRFDEMHSGKLVILGEEVTNARQIAVANILKDRITRKYRTYEEKNRPKYEMESHTRYLLCSNQMTDVAHLDQGDRRYTVIEVNSKYASKNKSTSQEQKLKFFGKLVRFGESKENLAKLHRWFADYEYEKSMIKTSYDTEVKRQNVISSLDDTAKFLMKMIQSEHPLAAFAHMDTAQTATATLRPSGGYRSLETTASEWPVVAHMDSLADIHNFFLGKRSHGHKNAQQLAQFFRENGLIVDDVSKPKTVDGKRRRVLEFPRREAIARYLYTKEYISEAEYEEQKRWDVDNIEDHKPEAKVKEVGF